MTHFPPAPQSSRSPLVTLLAAITAVLLLPGLVGFLAGRCSLVPLRIDVLALLVVAAWFVRWARSTSADFRQFRQYQAARR
jgi:CHASE2 domain-containing sensor protein